VSRPLTQAEKEADRIAAHKAILEQVIVTKELHPSESFWTSEIIKESLDYLEGLKAGMQSPEPEHDYEEFTPQIFAEIEIALDFLGPLLEKVLKEEEDAAELERLRAAEAERLEAERIEAAAAARAEEIRQAERKAEAKKLEEERQKEARRQAAVLEEQRKQHEEALEAERQRAAEALAAQEQAEAQLEAERQKRNEQLAQREVNDVKYEAVKQQINLSAGERVRHINTLIHAMAGLNRTAIATRIVDNTLHDSVHFTL
jgi:flagellar biosynthesis GTPase FlhF